MLTGTLTFFVTVAVFPALVGFGGIPEPALLILRGLFLLLLALSMILYLRPSPHSPMGRV